jgi:hypothetical protein
MVALATPKVWQQGSLGSMWWHLSGQEHLVLYNFGRWHAPLGKGHKTSDEVCKAAQGQPGQFLDAMPSQLPIRCTPPQWWFTEGFFFLISSSALWQVWVCSCLSCSVIVRFCHKSDTTENGRKNCYMFWKRSCKIGVNSSGIVNSYSIIASIL